jgi:hypothetical protein
MFTQKIVDSDAFLDMPLSSQVLYFHLAMRADDDGFVNNPKKITRYIGAAEDDLKLLFAKRFILGFESGVIVIKHWRMHNAIKKDRYHPTEYKDEMAMLEIKGNNAYTERSEILALPEPEPEWNTNGTNMEPDWNQDGAQMEPEVRLGKVRVGKEDKSINNQPKKKTKVFTSTDKSYLCALFLGKRISSRLPSAKEPTEKTLQRWADAFDKCNRIDGHSWDEIKYVLAFSQDDPFWQANILSGDTFRKQYMKLLAKWTSENKPKKSNGGRESSVDRARRMEAEGVFDD